MNKFEVHCTVPSNVTAYVSSPDARGTFDIVWSCLSILLICTWSVIHLNVPLQTTPQRKREKYYRAITRTFNKFLWMLVNLLAPEWSMGKAWTDYLAVSSVQAGFNIKKNEDDVPWTRMHTYLANMGGFTIMFDEKTAPAPRPEDVPPANCAEGDESNSATAVRITDNSGPGIDSNDLRQRYEPFTEGPGETGAGAKEEKEEQDDLPKEFRSRVINIALSSSYRRNASPWVGKLQWDKDIANSRTVMEAINGVRLSHFQDEWEKRRVFDAFREWPANLRALEGDRWILDASQLLLARQLGVIKKLPALLEDDVSDRNKGDLVIKVIAIGQVAWFVIQLIVRLVWHIPTSQLEIMTFAFAICTAFTYFLLLEKPKDVEYSIVIRAARYATPWELARLAVVGPAIYGWYRSGINIPNNSIHAHRKYNGRTLHFDLIIGATFSIAIFGGVHCVAWGFSFPNNIERLLWQVSSVVTAIAIPLTYMLWEFLPVFQVNKPVTPTQYEIQLLIAGIIVFIVGFVFCIARIFILVEVFRSLAFLPPRAFEATWTNTLLHIG
ncbi:hypothetical protein F5Y04DRAFT_229254 [Hypomontagnella monticulosa]|nr:hypothetical protein F5Y04DRAFT_229254 [Hypomontagnella monticulosa]